VASVLEQGREISPCRVSIQLRDWAAERTNYQNHIVEQLAHSIGNASNTPTDAATYTTSASGLMAEWSRYCMTPSSTSSAEAIRLWAGQEANPRYSRKGRYTS
jgi:hypothetical protein